MEDLVFDMVCPQCNNNWSVGLSQPNTKRCPTCGLEVQLKIHVEDKPLQDPEIKVGTTPNILRIRQSHPPGSDPFLKLLL